MKTLAIFFIKVSNGYQKHEHGSINRQVNGPIKTNQEDGWNDTAAFMLEALPPNL